MLYKLTASPNTPTIIASVLPNTFASLKGEKEAEEDPEVEVDGEEVAAVSLAVVLALMLEDVVVPVTESVALGVYAAV